MAEGDKTPEKPGAAPTRTEARTEARAAKRGYTEERNAQGVVSYVAPDGFASVNEQTVKAYIRDNLGIAE